MILSEITDLNEDSMETYGVVLSLLVVILSGIGPFFISYTISVFRVRQWENSILNRKSAKTEQNFGIAYVILIGMLLKQDPREFEAKNYFLKKTLERLSAEDVDVERILKQVHDKDVRVKHVAKWANLRLTDLEREELMYVLIEIVYMDESLIRKEMSLLLDLVRYTHISQRDLNSMIASHKQRLIREAEEQRRARKERQRKPTSSNKREKAFEILGVSPYAGPEEIKKAYRELAKRHHPDRFHGEKESLKDAAEARFIEIQKAYELVSQ